MACKRTVYGPAQRLVVETVFYDGARGDFIGTGSHYWVGDGSGEFANPNGPSASALLWAFFQRHPFADHPPPSISIASASASGTTITVTGSASAAAGAVVEVAVRLDGGSPQPPKFASGTSTWTVTFDHLPDNTRYVPIVTAKDSDGLAASVTGSPVNLGSPPANPPPVASIDGVTVTGDCVTVTGTASAPAGRLAGVVVELGSRGSKAAALSGNAYRYQECGLPGGTYTTRVEATDNLGIRSAAVSGPNATISDVEAITADWQMHMGTGRLRVYGAPCRNVGFGACDTGFAEIFLANQFNPFPLHRKPPSSDWYVDPQNLPQ